MGAEKAEYSTSFPYSGGYEITFVRSADGRTRLKAGCIRLNHVHNNCSRYFDLSVKDGEIVLTENGAPITEIVKQ